MAPCSVPKCCNLLMATICLAFLLGSLTGSSPRCLGAPSSSEGTGAGGGAVATCSTTGGSVTNFSASGGSIASCYAYATTSSSSRAPNSSPSSSGQLSVLTPIRVSVLALIPILADLRLV